MRGGLKRGDRTGAIRLFYSSVSLKHHNPTGLHAFTPTACQVPLWAHARISSCGIHNHLRRHIPRPPTSDMLTSDSLRPHGLEPARLLCLWEFSGKNIGVGCHFLLQETFPTQGSSPHLRHLLPRHAASFLLRHSGSPLLQTRENKKNHLQSPSF